MHKVIVERPRGGGGCGKQNRRANIPFEDRPRFQGIKRAHVRRKWFGEHLGPLRRWLRSQVGRPWNEVYSEACKVIKPDSVVRNHIKFHLLEMVIRHTFMNEGEIWCFDSNWRMAGGPVNQIAGRCKPFYVHPETGILCEQVWWRKRATYFEKEAQQRSETQRQLSRNVRLIKLNGLWFECQMEFFRETQNPTPYDVALGRQVYGSISCKMYGDYVHCVAKRQLSRKELRRYGLSNQMKTSEFTKGGGSRLDGAARHFALLLRRALKPVSRLILFPIEITKIKYYSKIFHRVEAIGLSLITKWSRVRIPPPAPDAGVVQW
ncbi:hypothetical protein Cflav_PD6482 [Pedosphaera parvula Ellin514]|uniref:Uncharacterized protein n=2 Tax=Pedosphaera TaxID=1032526 RepID=B9XDR0_PEDPL|nr:hypothetical protein Cflav_PD6482 [Pedosphaera parvula Ellin514]